MDIDKGTIATTFAIMHDQQLAFTYRVVSGYAVVLLDYCFLARAQWRFSTESLNLFFEQKFM